MRCAVCFAEMKPGPNGLECAACGAQLEPLAEDEAELSLAYETADTDLALNQNEPTKKTIGIVAIGIAIVVLAWAVLSNGLTLPSDGSERTVQTATINEKPFIISDERSIVSFTLRPSPNGEMVGRLFDRGCQKISLKAGQTVQWVDLTGAPVQEIKPEWPENWTVDTLCPSNNNGGSFTAVFDSGRVIGGLREDGQLRWAQLVSEERPEIHSVASSMENGALLAMVHDPGAGVIRIVSYGQNGDRNWQQSFDVGGSIDPPIMTSTGVGDLLLAWHDPSAGLHTIIISTSGLILDHQTLPEHRALHSLVQDEIGRTLIVSEGNQISFALISRSGDTEWQSEFVDQATPIGVLRHDESFLLFALSGAQLIAWAVDEFGTSSERL
ncbi:MAG: hypothetical protein AAF767_09955, partial [Pseudomonadota bacterium]